MRSLAFAILFTFPLLADQDDTFLIRGATVHPVASAEIQNGSVLVRDGKIVGVGRNLAAPKGTRIVEGKGLHVYPGMIDSGTQLGLAEISSVRESVDTGEIGKFDPQLRELKEFFEESRRYQKAKGANLKGFKTDLKFEAMLPVLEGKEPLVVMASRERAIHDAVQFADQQKVKVIIADPRELGKMGPE